MKVQMNKIDFIRKIEARNELYAREAREGNFKSYCLYTDYSFFTRRPVLGKVADAFQRVHDAFVAGTPIHIAVSMPPRAGKCVHPDTIVYTTSGPVKIKDINTGDKVISFNDGKSCVETVIAKSIKFWCICKCKACKVELLKFLTDFKWCL